MGLFDTIHTDASVVIHCDCGARLEEFQTKSLDSAMENYVLKSVIGADGIYEPTRLYLLDEPDEKYWVLYTDEEMAEYDRRIADAEGEGKNAFGTFFAKIAKERGGAFAAEAFLPENRRHRSMGELPHQHVRMYTPCTDCDRWVDVDMKFTDGVVKAMHVKAELNKPYATPPVEPADEGEDV